MFELSLLEKVQLLLSGSPLNNLRWYISQATLPPMALSSRAPAMPPPGHQSHKNTLSVVPEGYRRLDYMSGLIDTQSVALINDFIAQHVPTHPVRGDNNDLEGEGITIYYPLHRNPVLSSFRQPGTVNEVVRWVLGYPLETVQCISHHIWPETIDYTFDFVGAADVDDDIFFTTTWSPTATPFTAGSPPTSCTVFIQPPWVLSPRDLELFINCQTLPRPPADSKGKSKDMQFTAKERLWAKIWDECFRRRSNYFVVTTYWGWVFGAFSKGWTTGFVSKIHNPDQKGPTILECLLFWLGSSMRKPGGWQLPEVPEPVNNIELVIRPLIPASTRREATPPMSESEWDARSDAPSFASTDMDEEGMEVYKLLTGFDYPPPHLMAGNPEPRGNSRAHEPWHVNWWRSDVARCFPTQPIRSSSPTHSLWSQSSGSTIKDYSDKEVRKGDWLNAETGPVRMDVDS